MIEDAEYDRKRGFIFSVSSTLAGKYHCTTDQTHKGDSDLITVNVDPNLLTEAGKRVTTANQLTEIYRDILI